MRRDQWKDGRSAKELAKAWFPAPVIPAELSALLESSPVELGKINLCEGEPEVVVHFDPFRGPRNCDLLVHGSCQRGKIAISVEAKADEVFGLTVGSAFDDGEQTKGSNIPCRIRRLTLAVLGKPVESCRELRYQLLYGTAAALSAAAKHDAAIAIFVVHEFVTECTEDAQLEQNAADLDKFVSTFRPPDLNEFAMTPIRRSSAVLCRERPSRCS